MNATIHSKRPKTNTPGGSLDRRVLAPSRREIIEELKGEIQVYQSSYREIDGQVRNVAALRTIAALRAAVQIVKRQNTEVSDAGPLTPELKPKREPGIR